MIIHRVSDSVPGHKLCCICATFTKIQDLYVDANGDKWDMCRQCGHKEEEWHGKSRDGMKRTPTPDGGTSTST